MQPSAPSAFDHDPDGTQPLDHPPLDGWDDGEKLRTRPEDVDIYEASDKKGASELVIFRPAGNEFGDDEVVRLETAGLAGRRVRIVEGHQPTLPSGWQHRGKDPNPLPIHTEALVEMGQLADPAVNQVRLAFIGIIEERDIGFDRTGRVDRQLIVIERRQDRLATDDEDAGITSELARGSEDVREFTPLHGRDF